MRIAFLLSAALLCSTAVAATPYELLVSTNDVSKASGRQGPNSLALDVMSDGTATALEIRLDLGLAKNAKVDTSRCASGLPATHKGSCVFNGKELVVLVYSFSNDLLPAGAIDLGLVSFSGAADATAKGLTVSSFIAGAPDGSQVSSSVLSEGIGETLTK